MFWSDRSPCNTPKLGFESLTKDIAIEEGFILGAVCVKRTIRQTHEHLVAVNLKNVTECIWALSAFDETLFGCDADEKSTWFDCQLDRLDALLEMIAENVLDGKVVAHHVKLTCKRRLTNVPPAQKPHTEPNVQRPILRLLERLFVWIDGGDSSTNSLPLVPITAATASTIENVCIRTDPLFDEVTLRLIVAFTELIHDRT